MCLEFCFPDPPLTTLDRLEIEEVNHAVLMARFDNYRIFCKSHWGTATYNTKIGKKFHGLQVHFTVPGLRAEPVWTRGVGVLYI
jgi:hypothetical protein